MQVGPGLKPESCIGLAMECLALYIGAAGGTVPADQAALLICKTS